jgi:hypothetical protein
VTTVDGYLVVDYGQIGARENGEACSEMAVAPYRKPRLEARQRLSLATAADSKTSSIIISDRRRKDDIRLVGRTFDGLNIYTFRYRGEPKVHMGVLAQEALLVRPEAVSELNGYLAVDYARIGAAAAR